MALCCRLLRSAASAERSRTKMKIFKASADLCVRSREIRSKRLNNILATCLLFRGTSTFCVPAKVRIVDINVRDFFFLLSLPRRPLIVRGQAIECDAESCAGCPGWNKISIDEGAWRFRTALGDFVARLRNTQRTQKHDDDDVGSLARL